MATIFKSENRDFQENPHRIDHYRMFTDLSRSKSDIKPKNLMFDLRILDPEQYSFPYHYHHYSEELMLVISGSMTLRSPEGLQVVSPGDMVFCEMGANGAHQFYNHTTEPCTYLDIRAYNGMDMCEYPDSGKILVQPFNKVYENNAQVGYFKGEEKVTEVWEKLKKTK
jgi:uncharacterized cupin superfamily protein